jgi:hypothetical protein
VTDGTPAAIEQGLLTTRGAAVLIIVEEPELEVKDVAMQTEAGWWRIPTSHVTVSYTARTGVLRRVTARARPASGTLKIDPGDITLALVIDGSVAARDAGAPGLASVLGAGHVRYVVLRARATEVDAGGRWNMTGEIEIGDATVPTPVTVTHHGVYRFGDDTKAWLTVHADISHGVDGRRRRNAVALVADVLAIRPRPAPSEVLTVGAPQRGLPASPRV